MGKDEFTPGVFHGHVFADDRGEVRFVNDFNPVAEGVKRFYQVTNIGRGFIRAWHGHVEESKFVYVTRGSALVIAVNLHEAHNWIGESEGRPDFKKFVLSDTQPKILHIPPGYYNGFKTLKDDTDIIFFSTSTVSQSQGDDVRLPWNALGLEIWSEDYR